jgi:hypothetical protein
MICPPTGGFHPTNQTFSISIRFLTMRRRLLTVVILIALGSTSCTTIGPAYTPHPEVQSDQSLVYIYRPQVHALSGMTAVFTLDEVPVAKLENNGYVALLTKPGAHKLRRPL